MRKRWGLGLEGGVSKEGRIRKGAMAVEGGNLFDVFG